MSSFISLSVDAAKFWQGVKGSFSRFRAYLGKREDISRNDVVTRLGGLEPYPIRDDRWTVRPESLRAGGYTRYHRFFRGETGWSLVGVAAIRGKDGRTGRITDLNVAMFVNLDFEPEGGFETRIEVLTVDNGSDEGVTSRKSRIAVDGKTALEWKWCQSESDRAVRQRLFAGDGIEFRDLMESLEYKKGASAIHLHVEWEDQSANDTVRRKTLVEASGKGLWEACMRLDDRMKESTINLLWRR